MIFLLFVGSILIFKTDDCNISIVNETHLVKQVKNESPVEQFLLILDVTAAQIAEILDLPMNRVLLIPANNHHFGKINQALPATIHTIVAGQSVQKLEMALDIHQRIRKENTPLWVMWGPIWPGRIGLSLKVIESMASHEDLPSIVAFDTFVGNADRSQPNLFFDPITNRYSGIDLAASFNSDLGKAACEQLDRLSSAHFTLGEIAALEKYLKTLEELLAAFSPTHIVEMLLHNAKLTGFMPGGELWNEEVEARINFHKELIHSNYENCIELRRKLINLL